MPALVSLRYLTHPLLAESLGRRVGCLSRCVCLAVCCALPVAGAAQNASVAASSTAGAQLPDEVQAKLDKLNADLAAAKAKKDVAGAAKISNSIGRLYYGVSDYPRALAAHEQALADAKAGSDAQQQAAALNGMGGCYSAQGKNDKATEAFQQALEIASKSGDLRGQATALNGLGGVSGSIGQNQKALDYQNQALPLTLQAGDRVLEAATLRRIGVLYFNLGELQKALDSYNQALPILRDLGDHALEAATMNNIGNVYFRLGDTQKALDYYNHALPIRRDLGDRAGEAATLANIGTLYARLGEHQKALDYFGQALLIRREVGDRAGEAATLSNMGNVYTRLGENQKALDSYSQSLPLRRQAGDHTGEARTLNNIGSVYSTLGEQEKALDYYTQALPIWRQVGDRAGEASTLGNIGSLYSDLGEDQKALEYYNQALPIIRQVGEREDEAQALTSIGGSYFNLGENQKALDYYNQALPIRRQVGDRKGEADTLGDIGIVYFNLGENQKALDYYNQALPISQQVGDRESEAEALTDIGRVHAALGEKQKALDYYSRAIPIAAFVNAPHLQIRVLENLFDMEKVDRPSLAILYGKLAINLLQQLRGNISGLQEELQKSFLASIADQYHDLAALLIKQGRLAEAQQVLNLLKDREYRDYIRLKTSETLPSLTLTQAERTAEGDYQQSTAKVVEQGKRSSELEQKKARTPEEDKELQQLSDSLSKSSELMNEYFARLYKVFSKGGDASRQVAEITDETASLKQQIAKMPHTAALYTFVSKDRYSVIVITGSSMIARDYVIPEKDLHTKVAAFRQTIFDPSQDPKPTAQALYRILIGPIKADLDKAGAQTLIWSLDGVLRYVPFAALYDGQHYLVENYSLASFTPVSISHISEKPNLAAMSAAGMGISGKFDEKLKPLPMVEIELESIVRDPEMKGAEGVMPGTVLLNATFTKPAMEKQLDGRHSVVHIASHFVIRPGDDRQSYLLMAATDGDKAGYHMTVAEFRDNQKLSLEGTELLTLSACDTGVGGSSANGREVDGLATTAQRKGAKAVMSSLWQLNDRSTADLMADFYKRWVNGGGKVMKVEALRQAQLDLLMGKVVAKPDSSTPNAGTSYAQPYYWAPFVLMGNWQ